MPSKGGALAPPRQPTTMALPLPPPADNFARQAFSAAKMACGVGMLGLGLGLYAKQSKALPALALRPRRRGGGKTSSARASGAECASDCPKIPSLARAGNTGFDRERLISTARQGPCRNVRGHSLCQGLPTGALTTDSPTSIRRRWDLSRPDRP